MSDHEFDPTELKKVLNKMKSQATTEPYPFVCDNTLRPFYLLHILKKNKSDCYLPKLPTGKYRTHLVASGLKLKDTNSQLVDLIKETYKKCKEMGKVLIVPLKILPTDQRIGHENILIFNTVRNEVERFEPHGSQTVVTKINSERLNRSIANFVGKLDLGLKYIPSNEVQTKLEGLQILEEKSPNVSRQYKGQTIEDPDGYCAPWSYFYADLRLQFPHVSVKDLLQYVETVLGNDPGELRKFIRGQTKFLAEEVGDIDQYLDVMRLRELGKDNPQWLKAKQQYQNKIDFKFEKYAWDRNEEKKNQQSILNVKQPKKSKKEVINLDSDSEPDIYADDTDEEEEKMPVKKKSKKEKTTKLKKITAFKAILNIQSGITDAQTLAYLEKHSFPVNGTDKAGHSPLTMAAYQNKLKTVKYLIKKGAKINYIQKKSKDTALSSAIYSNVHTASKDYKVIDYLLSQGASMELARAASPEEVKAYEKKRKKK